MAGVSPEGVPYLDDEDPLSDVGLYTRDLADALPGMLRPTIYIDEGTPSIPDSTDTAVDLDPASSIESWDLPADWSYVGASKKLVYTGPDALWLFTASVRWSADADGVRELRFYDPGAAIIRDRVTMAAAAESQMLTALIPVGTGGAAWTDELQLVLYQSSGAALNANSIEVRGCELVRL